MKKLFRLSAITLTLVIALSFVSASEYRYDDPVPLGVAFYLVEGMKPGIEYFSDTKTSLTKMETLSRIYYNYTASVNNDIYAGGYFDRKNEQLHLLVTNKNAIVDTMNSDVIFHIVKYSLKELQKYQKIIEDNFLDIGISGSLISVKENVVKFTLFDIFPVDKISEFKNYIPDDSFIYEYDGTILTSCV